MTDPSTDDTYVGKKASTHLYHWYTCTSFFPTYNMAVNQHTHTHAQKIQWVIWHYLTCIAGCLRRNQMFVQYMPTLIFSSPQSSPVKNSYMYEAQNKTWIYPQDWLQQYKCDTVHIQYMTRVLLAYTLPLLSFFFLMSWINKLYFKQVEKINLLMMHSALDSLTETFQNVVISFIVVLSVLSKNPVLSN